MGSVDVAEKPVAINSRAFLVQRWRGERSRSPKERWTACWFWFKLTVSELWTEQRPDEVDSGRPVVEGRGGGWPFRAWHSGMHETSVVGCLLGRDESDHRSVDAASKHASNSNTTHRFGHRAVRQVEADNPGATESPHPPSLEHLPKPGGASQHSAQMDSQPLSSSPACEHDGCQLPPRVAVRHPRRERITGHKNTITQSAVTAAVLPAGPRQHRGHGRSPGVRPEQHSSTIITLSRVTPLKKGQRGKDMLWVAWETYRHDGILPCHVANAARHIGCSVNASIEHLAAAFPDTVKRQPQCVALQLDAGMSFLSMLRWKKSRHHVTFSAQWLARIHLHLHH